MIKKAILRFVLGAPIGITISYLITVIISASIGTGNFYPCAPQLVEQMGNELNAVILQTVLSALYGGGSAAISVIWEQDKWSIAKQTGLFFLLLSVISIPIAYFANWMPHNIKGILIYFGIYIGIFVLIFVIIWFIRFMLIKREILKMNEKI